MHYIDGSVPDVDTIVWAPGPSLDMSLLQYVNRVPARLAAGTPQPLGRTALGNEQPPARMYGAVPTRLDEISDARRRMAAHRHEQRGALR
jgi:hypothetical protein